MVTFIDTKKDILIEFTEDGVAENWFYSAKVSRFISLSVVKDILENVFAKNNFQPLQIDFIQGKQKYSFVGDDWDCLEKIEERMMSVRAINFFMENDIKIVTIQI